MNDTLNQTIWTTLYEVTDANTAYKHFTDIFNRALNQDMLETNKLVKTTPVNINPGSPQGLLSLYVIKITYTKLICVINQLALIINKKIYTNKLTNTIRAAEKMYYHAKFEMVKISY